MIAIRKLLGAGAPFAGPTVLALAQAYERETEWRKRRPKLSQA
jgi:hypothetical protein